MKRWLSNRHPSAPSSYESQAIPCCYTRMEPTTATTTCPIDSQLHVALWPPHAHCTPHQLPSPSVMSTLLCWLRPSLPHRLRPLLPRQLTFSTMSTRLLGHVDIDLEHLHIADLHWHWLEHWTPPICHLKPTSPILLMCRSLIFYCINLYTTVECNHCI